MGGYGSGRFRPKKACVEDVRDFRDAARLAREFVPWGGRAGTVALPPVVRLVARRLRTGGRVWEFICPGAGCGRRVRRLYRPAGFALYACRRCHGLTYRSCQEAHRLDAWIKAMGIATAEERREFRQALKAEGWG